MERIPIEEKRKKLKRAAALMKHVENHEGYERLLNQFLLDVKINQPQAEFIGEGHGPNNLNTYRKVKVDGNYLFEKVYFTDSPDFRTIQWVNNAIYPCLSNNIHLPKIQHIIIGKELSIVYSDFLSLKTRRASKIEQESVLLSKKLVESSILNTTKNIQPLQVFTEHFIYRLYVDEARKRLKTQAISTEKIEQKITSSPTVFTHMDIHPKNVFKNNTLIDWDYFDLLPVGMEQARLYFLLLVHEHKILNWKAWFQFHYNGFFDETINAHAFFNFTYFLYVFCSSFFKKGEKTALEDELILALKASVNSLD